MNKRPGHVKVTIETGYCSFCDRTRNLRREERQLGALIRTVIACESCHRLLSSSMGVAEPELTAAPEVVPAGAGASPADGAAQAVDETKPVVKRTPSTPKPKPVRADSDRSPRPSPSRGEGDTAGSKPRATKGRAQRRK